MSTDGVEAIRFDDSISFPRLATGATSVPQATIRHGRTNLDGADSPSPGRPRRTPRKSLIVVLPENHVVSPDLLADHLAGEAAEAVDVIVACAGQPLNLGALQRRIGSLQVLLAPAGTGTEDLRELAMNQAPGDVVTLLSGIPV